LHEQMIGIEDAPYTFEYPEYFKILPAIHNWSSDPIRIGGGSKVEHGFSYSSDNNKEWMSIETARRWVEENTKILG